MKVDEERKEMGESILSDPGLSTFKEQLDAGVDRRSYGQHLPWVRKKAHGTPHSTHCKRLLLGFKATRRRVGSNASEVRNKQASTRSFYKPLTFPSLNTDKQTLRPKDSNAA